MTGGHEGYGDESEGRNEKRKKFAGREPHVQGYDVRKLHARAFLPDPAALSSRSVLEHACVSAAYGNPS